MKVYIVVAEGAPSTTGINQFIWEVYLSEENARLRVNRLMTDIPNLNACNSGEGIYNYFMEEHGVVDSL